MFMQLKEASVNRRDAMSAEKKVRGKGLKQSPFSDGFAGDRAWAVSASIASLRFLCTCPD
jgi:hypothetical protein